MKNSEFEVLPINLDKLRGKSKAKSEINTTTKDPNTIKVAVYISNELAEKLKDYIYWERITQQEAMLQAIEEFLSDKSIKSRPEYIKEKKKRGRKRKNL